MLSKKTLNIISALFYPTNPAIPLIIVFSLNNLSDMFLGILLISVIPLIIIICYVKKMNIDIDMFEKEHRTMPYVIVILFFALAAAVFGYFSSKLMFAVALVYLNVTIAMTIINLKWKISAHSAGISGVATDAAYVLGPIAYPVFILVPFITFVRYKLNAHDLGQLIAGALMAIIISYLTFSVVYPL